jgi:hypothetical protein
MRVSLTESARLCRLVPAAVSICAPPPPHPITELHALEGFGRDVRSLYTHAADWCASTSRLACSGAAALGPFWRHSPTPLKQTRQADEV